MKGWGYVALVLVAGEAMAWADPVQAIALRRPDVDVSALLPDPIEHLRWPLGTTHPALEPRFPIAHALAEDGVTWTDLCRLGAQHRHVAGDKDLQRYLHAWCEVANGNVVAAFEELAIMGTPVVANMEPAIHNDLANLLAQSGNADHAEHLLAAAHLESVEFFDQLAATYIEIGDTADANEINEQAIVRQTGASNASKCQRLTRRLLLAPEVERPRLLDDIAALTDPRRVTVDPTCRSLHEELNCWLSPASQCRSYLQGRMRNVETSARMVMFKVYFEWDDRPASFHVWFSRAESLRGDQAPGAGVIEAVALAGMFLTSSCAKLHVVGKFADERRTSDKLEPKYDALLKRIATATSDLAKVEAAKRGEACDLIDRGAVVDLASLK